MVKFNRAVPNGFNLKMVSDRIDLIMSGGFANNNLLVKHYNILVRMKTEITQNQCDTDKLKILWNNLGDLLTILNSDYRQPDAVDTHVTFIEGLIF